MHQKIKNSDKHLIISNIIWSVGAVFINYLINFLITPYVTNNIGVEAYGFVSLATTFTNYIDIISVGLNAFAGRYISVAYHKNDLDKAKFYYSSTIIADLVLSIVVLIPSLIGIYRLEMILNIPNDLNIDVKILFITVLLKYLFTVMRTSFNASTFIANRLDIAEKYHSISYFIQAGVLFVLCTFLVPHVWYVGIAGCFATFFLLIANWNVSRKLVPDLRFNIKSCSFKAVKELVSSGIWNSLNSIGNVLNSGLDLLVTNLLLNTVVLGQISIGKNIATICYTLVTKVSASFRPKQLKLYAQSKTDLQVKLLKTTMRITGFVCNYIICIFIACGKNFLGLWIPRQNIAFIFAISIIVLYSDIVIGVVNPLYYVYTMTKKVKVPCFITIGMGLINVATMYILIKWTSLGAYAVVLTTLVLNLVHFIDAPLYSAYCLNIKWYTFYPTILKHLSGTALGSLVALILYKILPIAQTWTILLIKVAGCTILLLIVLCLSTFKTSEILEFVKKRRLDV